MVSFHNLPKLSSASDQDAQVADIRACWAADDGVTQNLEKSIGVAFVEKAVCIQIKPTGSLDGSLVAQCSRRGTVTVDSVRTSAKRNDVLDPGVSEVSFLSEFDRPS